MKANKVEILYSLEQLAGVLGISRGTVYNKWKTWKSEGRIKIIYKVDGSWRFPESEVIKLIESFKVKELSEILS